MKYLAGFLLLISSGCTTVALNAPTGTGFAAVRAAQASPEEIQAVIPTAPGCGEARVAMFVVSLPGMSELYQADLWLARQAPPLANQPRYLGTCVLNPFNPENLAQRR